MQEKISCDRYNLRDAFCNIFDEIFNARLKNLIDFIFSKCCLYSFDIPKKIKKIYFC